MQQAKFVAVSQAEAHEWLDRGGDQRRLRRTLVDQYRTDMMNGKWRPELCPPITFNESDPPQVTNGQHRLTALTECPPGTILYTMISTAEFFDIRDTNRTMADVIQAAGYDGATLSKVHNTALLWGTGVTGGPMSYRGASMVDRARWVLDRSYLLDNAPRIKTISDRLSRNVELPTVAVGVIGTLYDIAGSTHDGDGTDRVDDFLNECLDKTTTVAPIKALFRKDMKRRLAQRQADKMHAREYGYATARAYAAYIDGEPIKSLSAKSTVLRMINGFDEWKEESW